MSQDNQHNHEHQHSDDTEQGIQYTWLERLEYTCAGRVVRRYWLTIAFIFGFLTDVWLLDRVDDVLDNIILFFYVTLAFLSMTLLYVGVAGKVVDHWAQRFRVLAPLAIQYSFGGLLSGMFIFYGRSGDWLVSWPLLAFFAFVMVANEMVRDRATRLVYHLGVLFVGLFAYMVLVIPVFLGVMGPLVFFLSGVAALVIMILFISLLQRIIPRFMKLQMRLIIFSIGSIFMAYNFLYFSNIIPPIPLSLQEVGIYHQVVRNPDTGEYLLRYEPGAWWEFWKQNDSTFRAAAGNPVFCFSNVFAPTRIQTDIQHRWEWRDENGNWIEHARISYPIRAVGARGYRGFTQVQSYHDGRWRCSVETGRGQVLGRQYFIINTTAMPGELQQRIE